MIRGMKRMNEQPAFKPVARRDLDEQHMSQEEHYLRSSAGRNYDISDGTIPHPNGLKRTTIA